MLVAERMNRVSVLIMREDMEPVLREIARIGVLHLTRIEEIDEWAESLQDIGIDTLSDEYAARRRKINDLISEMAPEAVGRAEKVGDEISIADLKEVDAEIRQVEADLEPLIDRRRALTEKIAELRNLRTQIGALGPSGLPVGGLMRSSLLSSAVGSMDEPGLEKLRGLLAGIPSVVLPYEKEAGRLHVVCVVLRRDKSKLEDALRQTGFAKARLPEDIDKVSSEITGKVTETMAGLEQDLEEVRSDFARIRQDQLPVLRKALGRVEAAILMLNIKNYCKLTEKTCLFSGWVPREKTEALTSAIRLRTEGRAIVEVTEADKLAGKIGADVEIPVLFKQPPFLKPFEMLVQGYGTPAYRAVDPTVFVGITFLFMFGMMFGDVGHGLVLVGAGILLALRSARWREAGKLGVYCGAASVAFGLLYGSFFGLEEVLPTLWVKPLDNITDLFKVAIGFGIIVVSLGIILNIVNSLRTHSFLENFFDKSGPLVGVVYWAGVGIVIKWVMTGGGLPHPAIFYGLFIGPLVLFLARGPILRLIGKRGQICPDGVGTYAMESAVEVLEILMGYLANTVSFIRVAAFGLAHAGLFIAVFSLAGVVAAKPGGLLLSWVVLIFGNILIILLEGLVVTIQALRLEYYEFFGKFFKGLGSRYEPARLAGSRPGLSRTKGGE
jgi:V/A-type H+-transporting ATPase subunit I